LRYTVADVAEPGSHPLLRQPEAVPD